MPALIECARARVSEGEMVAAMQAVFGTYTETPVYSLPGCDLAGTRSRANGSLTKILNGHASP